VSTALGGASEVTGVSFNTSIFLGERDGLYADANYSRYSDPTVRLATTRVSQYFGGSATYTHNFAGRLSGFVTPSFLKVRTADGNRTNFQVEVGLRFSFGDRS
jgi:hypothetical protein